MLRSTFQRSKCGGTTRPLPLLVVVSGVILLLPQAKTILAILRAIAFEDRVYVLGGHDGTSTLRSVECFTPGPPGREPTWHQVGWDSSTFFCKPSSLLGGRYAGTSKWLLGGGDQWSAHGDRWLEVRPPQKFSTFDPLHRPSAATRASISAAWRTTALTPTSLSNF